jgi:hypothetical protein
MISSSVCADGPGKRSSPKVEAIVNPEGHQETNQRHSYEDVLEGFLLHKPPNEFYGLHNSTDVLQAEENEGRSIRSHKKTYRTPLLSNADRLTGAQEDH